MIANIDESSIRNNSPINFKNDCEPAELEHFEKTELKDRDLAKSPSRSRNDSIDNESDSRNSTQEKLSRKRRRSASSRSLSPRRKAYRGRDGRRHNNSERDNPKPSRCLGVFGLSFDTREHDLRDVFAKYGEIEKIIIVRSFAFVYYAEIEEARSVKERCNEIEIKGRIIRVDYSMTEQPKDPSRPRSRYNNNDWNRSHGRNGNRRHYNNRKFRSSPHRNRRRS